MDNGGDDLNLHLNDDSFDCKDNIDYPLDNQPTLDLIEGKLVFLRNLTLTTKTPFEPFRNTNNSIHPTSL